MKILFVHQNFPAQFKHLAPELHRNGHEVKVLTIHSNMRSIELDVVRYRPARSNARDIHPWLLDMESKVIRAEAAFHAAIKL